MKSRHFLLSILLMFSLSGCSNDSEFDETLEKAQRGDAEAQYNLGEIYDKGKGVPEDDTEALKWYRLAAEQGDAGAQYKLGVMYESGRGVHKGWAGSYYPLKWYRLAAEGGYADAQYKLGYMYATGQGVPYDYTEAVKWYRLAAEQGEVNAQFNLGRMYARGQGVPKDQTEALKWLRLAAEQGEVNAQVYLGRRYAEGNGVPKDHTGAAKWYRMAAEQGDALVQTTLGNMYAEGEGVPEDNTEAVKWYRLAAEQGEVNAQAFLGYMYANGEGVPKDDTEAFKWYRMAAGQGDAEAQYKLGVMYESGRGVPRGDTEAVKWYQLSAEQGNASAQYSLSLKYDRGEGVHKDDTLGSVEAHSSTKLPEDVIVHPSCFGFTVPFERDIPKNINCSSEDNNTPMEVEGIGVYAKQLDGDGNNEGYAYYDVPSFWGSNGNRLAFYEIGINTGGSGTFSSIILAKVLSNAELELLFFIPGGDRCNDGYIDLGDFNNKRIEYTLAATPFRLINPEDTTDWRRRNLMASFWSMPGKDPNPIPTLYNWMPYSDIANSAQSCAGRIHKAMSIEDGSFKTLGVSFDKERLVDAATGDLASCFTNWINQTSFEKDQFISISDWDNAMSKLGELCGHIKPSGPS